MGISVKPAILATPTTLLRSDHRTYSPPSSPPTAELTLKFRDVDERVPLLPTLATHQQHQPHPKIINREMDMDIDERASYTHHHHNNNDQHHLLQNQSAAVAETPASDANYEAIKKELIIKVMKAIADEDAIIFSQIPKQTLTELLVKLLSTNGSGGGASDESRLSTTSIETLITTLTPSKPSKGVEKRKSPSMYNDSEYGQVRFFKMVNSKLKQFERTLKLRKIVTKKKLSEKKIKCILHR